jgi:isocitrate dehydrogenase
MLLSGAMLLDHVGWSEAAHLVRHAVLRTLSEGLMTGDLTDGKPSLGTKEFAEAVLHRL